MNISDQTRNRYRYWAPTSIAGAAATSAITAIFTAVAVTPAYSVPSMTRPVDAGSITTPAADTSARYCFMGRPGWARHDIGDPPCRSGKRDGAVVAQAGAPYDPVQWEVRCMRVPSAHEKDNPHYCVVPTQR